jgi:hypothetical protein
VIHNCSIAFDHAVNAEVAAIAGVGDLTILEHLDGDLHRIHSSTPIA